MNTFTDILQANVYAGYHPLSNVDRDPNPLRQAFCRAHSQQWPLCPGPNSEEESQPGNYEGY